MGLDSCIHPCNNTTEQLSIFPYLQKVPPPSLQLVSSPSHTITEVLSITMNYSCLF